MERGYWIRGWAEAYSGRGFGGQPAPPPNLGIFFSIFSKFSRSYKKKN